MNNLEGVALETQLAATDRGTLWRAARHQPGDRIVRKLAPHFCDQQFLLTLAQLRDNPLSKTLAIVNAGWIGESYCLEYLCDSPWQDFSGFLVAGHWRPRLYVLYKLIEAAMAWESGPVRPLGLHTASLVMVDLDGLPTPRLLACPPRTNSTTLDYWDVDAAVLACVPPEAVRGIYADPRLQDGYAAAALTALALGCPMTVPKGGPPALLEAKVCGRLAPSPDLETSAVEPFLRSYPPLQNLFGLLNRYLLSAPESRPPGLQELFVTCAKVLSQTEAVELARTHPEANDDPCKISELLEWGFQTGSDSVAARELAAELAVRTNDLSGAIRHLDRAVAFAPGSIDLRRTRCSLYARRLQFLSPPLPGESDPEGDAMIGDLEWLLSAEHDPIQQRGIAFQMAEVLLRRQDYSMAANLLYTVVENAPSDINAMYLYAQCLEMMGSPADARQTAAVALDRIDKMARNEMLTERKAQEWREKFQQFH